MKRTIKLIGALLVLLTITALLPGCGNKIEVEVDFDAIIEANRRDSLLKLYDSYEIIIDNGKEQYGYYVDSEIVYEWSDEYIDENGYTISAYGDVMTKDFYAGISEGERYSIVYAGMEIDTSWADELIIVSELFESETLMSSKEQDGFIIFETKLTEKDMIDLGYWAQNEYAGCYYLTKYTIDKETNVIHSIEETFVYGLYDYSTVKYEVFMEGEIPADAKDIYTHVVEADEYCSVTFVYDPNMATERSYSVEVPKGDVVYFYWLNDDFYVNVYADRACTKTLGSSVIANEDVEIYLTQ